MKLAFLAAALLMLVVVAVSQEQKRHDKRLADEAGQGKNRSRAEFGKRVGPSGFENGTGESRKESRAELEKRPDHFRNETDESRNGSREGFERRVDPASFQKEMGRSRNESRDGTGRRRIPGGLQTEVGEGRNRSRADAPKRKDASNDQAQDQVTQEGQEGDRPQRRPVQEAADETNEGRRKQLTDGERPRGPKTGQVEEERPRGPRTGQVEEERPRGPRTGQVKDEEANDDQEVDESQKKLFRRPRSSDQEKNPQQAESNLGDDAEESESNAEEPGPVLEDNSRDYLTAQEGEDQVSKGDQVNEEDLLLPRQAAADSQQEQPKPKLVLRRGPSILPIKQSFLGNVLADHRPTGLSSTGKSEARVNQIGLKNGLPPRQFIPPYNFFYSRPQPANDFKNLFTEKDSNGAGSAFILGSNLVKNGLKLPVQSLAQNILKNAGSPDVQGESSKIPANFNVLEWFKKLSLEKEGFRKDFNEQDFKGGVSAFLAEKGREIPDPSIVENFLQKIQHIKDEGHTDNQGESQVIQPKFDVSELFKKLSPENQEKVKKYLAGLPLPDGQKLNLEQLKSQAARFVKG